MAVVRNLWTVAVLVAMLGVPCPAAEENPPGIYVEPQSDIPFPEVLGTLKREAVEKYDQREMGVRIRYGGPSLIKTDVFLYDGGEKDLGTGTGAAVLAPHFQQIKQALFEMEKRGHYRSVKKLTEEPISLQTRGGKLAVFSASFEYSQTADTGADFTGKRISHTLLTAYRGLYFKIRFTYPEKDKDVGEKALKAFLSDCGKLMRVESPERSR